MYIVKTYTTNKRKLCMLYKAKVFLSKEQYCQVPVFSRRMEVQVFYWLGNSFLFEYAGYFACVKAGKRFRIVHVVVVPAKSIECWLGSGASSQASWRCFELEKIFAYEDRAVLEGSLLVSRVVNRRLHWWSSRYTIRNSLEGRPLWRVGIVTGLLDTCNTGGASSNSPWESDGVG